MSPLTSNERALIDEILRATPVAHLKDYDKYLTGSGYVFMDFDDIGLTQTLFEKGWLRKPRQYHEVSGVHLTKEAWLRFEIKEWSDVEEKELEAKRGEESGSW